MPSYFPLTATNLSVLPEAPLVSVIIDNYNYGRFLNQSIDSVLAQTYRNFELIVVDDGSTDNSQEVIQSYGDRIIPIFQQNSGQGGAFNSGIAKAKGDIVCLLDSDDYFHPEKLAKIVAAFKAHPAWVQISHQCISVNTEGQALESKVYKTFSKGDVRSLLLQYGKYRSTRTSALSYRREVLMKVLPINTHKLPADSYLVASVPFYGEIGYIDESLMFYRIHGANFHARSTDYSYHMKGREAIARYVNETAAKVGLTARLDLRNDADYRIFSVLKTGNISRLEALQIIALTLREGLSLGRSAKELAVKLTWVSICVLLPSEGPTVLQMGLGSYLKYRLLGKEPQRFPSLDRDTESRQTV